MTEYDIDHVVRLIGRAMNLDEADQARKTFEFHFACRRHALDDGRTYYVLEEGEQIRGVAGLHHYVWGPSQNVWLAWFAVDPDQHRRGLGRNLLRFIEDRAQQLGYMRLFIETYSTPEFAKARAFYGTTGFFRVGHIDSYLPNGGDMVVLCKDLAPHA
jgi:GNAT superfamily N-acetyltransferase